ncbi:MAG: hypothetical protein M3O46_19960, partial [Myxococcota bacterium]|nr:hypothetical protein [Myxococcota bacterium]
FTAEHVERVYARSYRDACDRLARAQRRTLRAQSNLDLWAAELCATLREIGPVAWGRDDRSRVEPGAWLTERARALRELAP